MTAPANLEMAKGRVLKADDGAWFCDCGCKTVYSHCGTPLASGVDEADAGMGALEHHSIRARLRAVGQRET